jgi:hypothetical protein
MPLYTAECAICGHVADYAATVAEREKTPSHCDAPMVKILTPTKIQADTPDYRSPIDGHVVHGRKGRRDDLARNNCRPFEGRESEERAVREFHAQADKKFDAKLTDQLSHAYESMAPEKKKALEFITTDVKTDRG